MNRTVLDLLFQVEPPWVVVGPGEHEREPWLPSAFYSRPGVDVCVRKLRGWKMRTVQGLMDEFGAALQFFDGFGENWHALEECLSYLDEWLPAEGYVLVVERAEEVLQDEGGALWALLKTLDLAGRFWSQAITDNDRFNRPARPFHVLLNVSTSLEDTFARFQKAASEANVELAWQSSTSPQ